MSMTPARSPARLLLPVAFLAGFTFLVYEVCWHRRLALDLGATVAAATAVLSTFMAGLGAGAWWWGPRADASGRPARLLAWLLAGTGLASAAAHELAAALLPRLAPAIAPWDWVPALAAMLAPALLMGGVFPALGRLLAGEDGPLTATLGRLYAVETLGSAAGALAAGLVLLGTFGLRGSVLACAAIDVGLAVALVAWSRVHEVAPAREPASPAPGAPPTRPTHASVAASQRRAILAATFTCGLASLGLQALWFRLFRVHFTNTSYTFALVTAVAIAGSFAGSAWLARRPPAAGERTRMLARAVGLFAVLALVSLAIAVRLPQLVLFPFESALADPFLRVLVAPFAAALLVVLPPAACAGYALPLAGRLLVHGRGSVGAGFGLGLAVNTAGSVAGPLVATLVLLPALGAVRAAIVLPALLLAATAWLAATLGRRRAPATLAATGGAFALLLAAALAPEVRVLPPSVVRFDREVLVYRETGEGTLTVARDRGGPDAARYSFVNNSAVIGSSYDAFKAVRLLGHLPFLAGLQGRDVLVVGFGMGVTASAIAAQPGLARLECVELVPGLREASAHYRELNQGIGADARLVMFAGDGRRHLRRSARSYDLVSCDPTHPVLGSGALYTREWFELCRQRLNPGGMLAQYLPLHKLGERELLSILRAFHEVFPEGSLWLGQFHAVLLGATAGPTRDFAAWSAAAARLGRDLNFPTDPHHLAATLALDGDAIGQLSAGARANTDNLCVTEFFTRGCLDERNLPRNLRRLAAARIDPAGAFSGVADPERLRTASASQALVTEALAHILEGDRVGGQELLRRARANDPLDQELPFLVRLYR